MENKPICNLCRTVGPRGAEWIAQVGDDKLRVHKPCGRRLVETAPEGTEVKLYPSKELRQVFAQQRREREVKAFWQQKFDSARAQQR